MRRDAAQWRGRILAFQQWCQLGDARWSQVEQRRVVIDYPSLIYQSRLLNRQIFINDFTFSVQGRNQGLVLSMSVPTRVIHETDNGAFGFGPAHSGTITFKPFT